MIDYKKQLNNNYTLHLINTDRFKNIGYYRRICAIGLGMGGKRQTDILQDVKFLKDLYFLTNMKVVIHKFLIFISFRV